MVFNYTMNTSIISYLLHGILRQCVFMFLENIVDEGVPSVEHGVPHSGSRITHNAESLLRREEKRK